MWLRQGRRVPALLAALILHGKTLAQNTTSTGNSATARHPLLCGSPISSANASGVYTFATQTELNDGSAPQDGEPVKYVPDPSWAITVAEANDSLKTTIWYDTAGQNYSDDLALNYDVCAYIITPLPVNTVRLGQDDPGDCSSTLSAPCRDALMNKVSDAALMWTTYSSPPPNRNLTADVLPYICSQTFNALASGDGRSAWPSECAQEFTENGKDVSYGLVANLTGYNNSRFEHTCNLTDGDQTFHAVAAEPERDFNGSYDNATRSITVALAVYFPVANWQRTSFTNYANSTLRCLRPNKFSPGSRVSPALPAGTPYSSETGSGLSGGAIAGIVVGVVVGLALITAIGVFIWLRKKKQAKARATGDSTVHDENKEVIHEVMHEVDGSAVRELHAEGKKPELDNSFVAELGNGQGEPGELEGSFPLQGQPPH